MKQPVKLLVGVLAAASVTGLAFFGWSVKAKDDATFHLANGVQVTPVEVKSDDMAQLLDAKFWKFDVTLPRSKETYNYTLVLLHHGTIIGTLGGTATSPTLGEDTPHPFHVMVGMVPTEDTFSGSRQVKYNIKVDGVGTEGTFANPFGDHLSYSETAEVASKTSMIYLMSGSKHGIYGLPDENDVAIGFKIEPLFTKQ